MPSPDGILSSESVSSSIIASNNDDDEWMFPLMLSFLAGASTCVGAAIVFCFDAKQIEQSMTFSLSLAASVMITVSVISIGPECLEHVVTFNDSTHVTIDLWLMGQRLLSFGAGCFGYWLLSKALAAFPEPESFFVKSNQQPQSPSSAPNTGNSIKYSKTTKNSDIRKDEEDQDGSSETISLMHLRRSTSGDSTEHQSSSTPKQPRSSPTNASRNLSMRRTPSNILEEVTFDNYESKQNKQDASSKKRSWRVAMLLFFSLLFHNFPEGLAVGKFEASLCHVHARSSLP